MMEMRYVDGPPAHPTSLGEVWCGITRPCFVGRQPLEMRRVDGPPAHPTSLRKVWCGITRPLPCRKTDS